MTYWNDYKIYMTRPLIICLLFIFTQATSFYFYFYPMDSNIVPPKGCTLNTTNDTVRRSTAASLARDNAAEGTIVGECICLKTFCIFDFPKGSIFNYITFDKPAFDSASIICNGYLINGGINNIKMCTKGCCFPIVTYLFIPNSSILIEIVPTYD
jgi:hypothetical protein